MSPILGFRSFRWYAKDGLHSLSNQWDWRAGENAATCNVYPVFPHSEAVPAKNCSCGLYAFSALYHCIELASEYPGNPYLWSRQGQPSLVVVGLVVGYGKVVVHERGWRAQKARVVAITHGPYTHNHIGDEMLPSIASDYGIPLWNEEQALRYGREFGEYVAVIQGETEDMRWTMLSNLPAKPR